MVEIKGEVLGHARERLFRPHADCVMRKAVKMKVIRCVYVYVCLRVRMYVCVHVCVCLRAFVVFVSVYQPL